jgi:two-component system OmpR family response regulator
MPIGFPPPYAVSMTTVGICEDDPRILGLLAEALARDGVTCVLARTGREALARFTGPASLDVIILDIGLPDSDGRDVCQALRTAGQSAPILFLTARDGLHDLVSGYSAGGDDYVTKPFALREVQLRVAALARRRPPAFARQTRLRLDPGRFSLRFDEAEVRLTPIEFRMLAALASHPGEVVRRREIVAAAWPDGAAVSENTIDSYVRRIRAKLDAVHAGEAVETIRGVGYVLREGM